MNYLRQLICGMIFFVMAWSAGAQSCALASPPQEFEAFIGSHFGSKLLVRVEAEQKLTFRAAFGPGSDVWSVEPIYIVPTAEQWSAFYTVFDEKHVWDWKDSYVPEQAIPDSVSWRVKLVCGERNLNSGGYGATPEEGFSDFLKAVSDLTGYEFR
ncbi:MAG: hypothetical protein ACRCWR_06455 [Saezia sp.]